ncbi:MULTISPECIES: hypothetical protein [Streptomyces]|uniref:hypothetical protein n=1 Tax=Streptomyces TaxID=1883 RepID=UPI0016494FAE|nr:MULTISPECIES: hypothetical protein [Streptomyces]MDI7785632.1 hypothetical protein [Streptomyces cavourensis]
MVLFGCSLPAPVDAGAWATSAVAVLAALVVKEHVSAAPRPGADGFLLKDMAPEQLVHAVRILASGGGVLAPAVGRQAIDGYLATRGGCDDSGLLPAVG